MTFTSDVRERGRTVTSATRTQFTSLESPGLSARYASGGTRATRPSGPTSSISSAAFKPIRSFAARVEELRGKRVGCFCRPAKGFDGKLLCHGAGHRRAPGREKARRRGVTMTAQPARDLSTEQADHRACRIGQRNARYRGNGPPASGCHQGAAGSDLYGILNNRAGRLRRKPSINVELGRRMQKHPSRPSLRRFG